MMMKNRTFITILSIVALSIFALLWKFGPWKIQPESDVLAVSGTLEATAVDISFRIPGMLAGRHVFEGDTVKQGDLLAELDKRDAEARLRQAEAAVNAAEARLKDMEQGSRSGEIAEMEARAEQARAKWVNLKEEAERSKTLFDGGAISRQRLDRDTTAADMAGAELRAVQNRVALLRDGFRENTIKASSAQLEEARAFRDTIAVALSDHYAKSPLDGVVSRTYLETGEMVAAGRAVLVVTNLDRPWVRVYIPEKEIGKLLLGSKASVKVDSFPEKKFAAKVSFISPEAEFTPKNVQTQEERVKLVFAVNVIVENPGGELKPGMPADVTILVNQEAQ